MNRLKRLRFGSLSRLPIVLLLASSAMFSQTAKDAKDTRDGSRTKALPLSQSSAEVEADRVVSLSADKIISILNQEQGLLLECKKLLVRTAYSQGRILEPADLEDDAFFALIRKDSDVRVLLTREIEDRSYVRAKPRQREATQGTAPMMENNNALQAALGGSRNPRAGSQEEQYWSQRQGDTSGNSQNAPSGGASQPRSAPGATTIDPKRLLLQAQAQSGGGDSGGLSGLASAIGPDQLATLLGAKMGGGTGSLGVPEGEGTDLSSLGKGLDLGTLMGGGTGVPGLMAPAVDPYASQGDEPAPPPASRPTQASPTNQTQPTLAHHPNPYADVPSLYDLYSQYSHQSPTVKRFGEEVFRNGTGNLDELPMDLPVGPEYVLGPGDGLNIDLFGGAAQRLRRVITREGQIALPDVGDVQVAGRTLGDVQHMVQAALRTQYRDVEADVSITRLRSIRVYVVGDVQRPGAYDVSSLSTPLNAVFQAGGPTSQGSLRILKQYRGKQLVQQVDVYDLLLHGVNSSLQRLESGDTVLVPPLVAEVTVQGMVRRPAIYELNGESDLAEVLQLAGGVLPSGTLRHVDVERVVAHESRTMLRLEIPETNNEASVGKALEDFKVQDGDKIQISPIVPVTEKTVYLDGHVFRPGKYAYRDGMKVTDLIKSYKDLMPEPYKQHAEIVRLQPPDNAPEVLAFNLDDALGGKEQDIDLKPFDTVRVFGRFDFEDAPVVTVTGAVRDPGDHVTNGATYLRDAVYLAGNTTPDAELSDVQVFRRTEDGRLKVISVDLKQALAGEATANILLEPKDRVFVHKNPERTDPATVSVEGEVVRPGKYPLAMNMTAAQLVQVAGGLKRGAFTDEADLTRYEVSEGSKIVSDHVPVPIAKALANEADADVRLRDGDVLTIRQLTGWNDLGATIAVTGEVKHPGTFGIQEGERLSSVLQRAGGFSSGAYPYGAVFERVQIRDMEQKNRSDLMQRVQAEEAEVKILPGMDTDQQLTAQAAVLQYKSTLEKLQSTPPEGRLVIHISSNLKHWANTPMDIQVRAGDTIYIPKRPNIVLVDGAVYNPTAITFKPGKDGGWYLRQAGGPTQMANNRATFVIRADGSVVGGPGGLFTGGVTRAALQPGDMVVVPEKAYSINNKWKTTLESAQLAYAVGIAIQVARSF